MKKVIFLNGSPKRKRAVSEKFLKIAEDCLEGQIQGEKLYIYESEFSDEYFDRIYEADAVVMALPLYIDCLPARVLEFMAESKEYLKNREEKRPELYFIINCGFLEYSQNDTAIKIIEKYAEKNGLNYRGGVSVGSGAMILQSRKKDILEKVLKDMAEEAGAFHYSEDMPEKTVRKINVDMPRFLFKAKADKLWVEAGAKKGLDKKALRAKYY